MQTQLTDRPFGREVIRDLRLDRDFDSRDLRAIEAVSASVVDVGSGGNCRCIYCEDAGRALRHLDLTPLSKFVGAQSGRELLGQWQGERSSERYLTVRQLLEVKAEAKRKSIAIRPLRDDNGREWYPLTLPPMSDRNIVWSKISDSKIWDYYGTTPPTPEEKSPADKALDDFIAKRKAKREAAPTITHDLKRVERDMKEWKDGQNLGRALSKAYVHRSEMTERLMPYRVQL